MAHEVRIPKLGVAVEEAQITEWQCSNGDDVEAGQVIYVLATDKTEVEIESPAAGVITIIGEVEIDYPVGTIVATID
ncbi:biotin/lipoyl-containing protein [Mycolicibacterium diernhoferi]|uniref:Dihydrolipoamide acyltransferase n=1 Tax=Mycolicibacterium diernhoferi TaxID=1801 RepID=A0A1Q4HFZ3_9MYCO|nr:biotin/lipoyl-containing protein [Mycolicibacterium diernhoferi]OJZ66433.1 dihydrolipoamide acyltransferase [Mycolicibacterium diernhoferi]OPE56365.1 dihydrolipoamide acyltransferase [Mycolicibacterium diernhoferi]PEG56308.1 dihydrolipoamide acyltransferase [Mycolicibacterium diernhoferi]QYL24605.1 dihydrolipoamide acyltransferase [Mycolicibacterium diernhoferi]